MREIIIARFVDLFRNFGYIHLKTIIRRIPTKRMPSKSSAK